MASRIASISRKVKEKQGKVEQPGMRACSVGFRGISIGRGGGSGSRRGGALLLDDGLSFCLLGQDDILDVAQERAELLLRVGQDV